MERGGAGKLLGTAPKPLRPVCYDPTSGMAGFTVQTMKQRLPEEPWDTEAEPGNECPQIMSPMGPQLLKFLLPTGICTLLLFRTLRPAKEIRLFDIRGGVAVATVAELIVIAPFP